MKRPESSCIKNEIEQSYRQEEAYMFSISLNKCVQWSLLLHDEGHMIHNRISIFENINMTTFTA